MRRSNSGDYPVTRMQFNNSVKIDGFSTLMHRVFITFYCTRVSRNGKMQVERERNFRFCKKLLNLAQRKRVPVVSVFSRLKNKELLAASDQEK